MFARVEATLERADAGCQLWAHEISTVQSLIVNTLYLLDLDFFQRRAAERAREVIIAYANSRCIAELHALRHRDEALRAAAHAALDELRAITQTASLNARAASLGLKTA
jgi:hypothetical protein